MHKILLATAAFAGLTAVTTLGAAAAPSASPLAAVHVTQAQPSGTRVDYYDRERHHWHHRHWEHRRWRYYD